MFFGGFGLGSALQALGFGPFVWDVHAFAYEASRLPGSVATIGSGL